MVEHRAGNDRPLTTDGNSSQAQGDGSLFSRQDPLQTAAAFPGAVGRENDGIALQAGFLNKVYPARDSVSLPNVYFYALTSSLQLCCSSSFERLQLRQCSRYCKSSSTISMLRCKSDLRVPFSAVATRTKLSSPSRSIRGKGRTSLPNMPKLHLEAVT